MENDTILIMIAAYRDPELIPTIESAIQNADKPERLHFAVCYQEEVTSPSYSRLKEIPHMKMIVVPPNESKGCCRARALTQMLYDGETYILQIDSHMRFAKDWDSEIIRMLGECPSRKPLFSMYCNTFEDYEYYQKSFLNPEIRVKPAFVQGAGYAVPFRMLEFGQARPVFEDFPCPGAFISGHFIFAKAEFIFEIPADSELYFEGEETTLSIRAWTHGWDIYTPYRNLVFHKYVEAPKENETRRVTHWDEHSHELFDYLSKIKVKNIALGIEKGIYGVGEERSIEEYEAFCGVDFKNMTVSEKTKNGMFGESSAGVST